jgi:cysteine desulfurase
MDLKTIYLDNNATTAVAPEVFEAMRPFLQEHYGNPSSFYSIARYARRAVEEAREHIAALFRAHPDEIIFTSCGTESDNTAINSAISLFPDRRHIITTTVEHPAILNFVHFLESKGYRITYLPVDQNGMIDCNQLRDLLAANKDVAIVSIMHANNETGVLFPIADIGAICREQGVLFHCDAVQSVGKIPIDLSTLPIDMLSLSGHKLHAPKGIGVLYVRKNVPFAPFVIGGHQENGHRAGTENVASIVGLGKACALAQHNMKHEIAMITRLRDHLEKQLIARCPHTRINGNHASRLPNTTNISFGYVEGEAILLKLDTAGICASSGSACSSGSDGPSHVLRAMNVPPEFIRGSIRFSLSRYSTAAEIERTIDVIPNIIEDLRRLSPWMPASRTTCVHDSSR